MPTLSSPHIWLKSLTRRLSHSRAEKLLREFRTLSDGREKIYGDSVINIALHANKPVFDYISKEDKEMLECLRYWYEPEMEQIKINSLIGMAKELDTDDDIIIDKLMKMIPCQKDKALEYLKSYNSSLLSARAGQ